MKPSVRSNSTNHYDFQPPSTRSHFSRSGMLKIVAAGLAGVATGAALRPSKAEAATASTAASYNAIGPSPASNHTGVNAAPVDNKNAPLFGVGVSGLGSSQGVSGGGPNIGVYGSGGVVGVSAYSASGIGVLATSGTSDAISANSTSGIGVNAKTAGNGIHPAIQGKSTATDGVGINGVCDKTQGTGVSGSGGQVGVAGSGGNVGVQGNSGIGGTGVSGTGDIGVSATVNPGSTGYAIKADGGSLAQGIYAQASNATAIQGYSTSAIGGDFFGGTIGVQAHT